LSSQVEFGAIETEKKHFAGPLLAYITQVTPPNKQSLARHPIPNTGDRFPNPTIGRRPWHLCSSICLW